MKRLLIIVLVFSKLNAQPIIFPLRQSNDKHYIVDQNNKPIFLKGCAAWRLGYNVSLNDAKKFLADRKSKGFNALIVEITPDDPNKGGDVANIYGEHCFINKDVSEPNEKFFQHCDSILQLCSDMHFVVVLFPLYLGCCHDGWLEILQQTPNTPDKCKQYGAWVANRYQHFSNLIWASGGDHNETPESIAFAEGVASVDTSHLHIYHTNPAYTSTERLGKRNWLTLSSIYTYFPAMNIEEYHVYGQIYNETLRNNYIPYVMLESAYEYERDETTQTLRRQAYWSLLSHASGHFFGNRDIWMMNDNWKNALNTPGNKSMEIFHSFVDSIPWQKLKPDWMNMMFVSSRGEFNSGTTPGGDEYATAAYTDDSSLAILYMPTYRKVAANMSRFNKDVHAIWFDPSSGKYYADKKIYKNNAVAYFQPPMFNNAQGFDDWVLILKTKKDE